MLDKLLKRLNKEGRIRKQEVGFVQIEALLREAILDLKEARKISHIAERATYMLAYTAMLKAGRALIFLEGFMPADGAQHRTVVEVTEAILGEKYKNLVGQFEGMRRKRNRLTYEAGILLSRSESQKALADAIALVEGILKRVKSRNPQMDLGIKWM